MVVMCFSLSVSYVSVVWFCKTRRTHTICRSLTGATFFYLGVFTMKYNFYDFGLMQLRIYAKKIGVKAPTACTKIELIEKIKQVEDGIVKPYFSERGRPRKNDFFLFDEHQEEREKYLKQLDIENKELKNKIKELTNINEKIEKEFFHFKNTLAEIIKTL